MWPIRNAVGWSFPASTTTTADCGLRIAECIVRNPQFEIRNLAASLPVRLLALIFCFVLIAVAPAQTPNQQQPIEAKLPILKPDLVDGKRQTPNAERRASTDQQQPIEAKLASVHCTFAPTKDAVRWRTTPATPTAPGTEVDESTQGVESQTPNSGGRSLILNPNLPDGKRQTPNAERQASTDQQQPVEPKLPSVRCTFAPTKDVVRWKITPATPGTPTAPGTEVDESTQGVESQTPNSGGQLPILNPDLVDGKRQTPNAERRASTDQQPPVLKTKLANGEYNCGMSNPQSAIRNPQFNSDSWFQISTETPEPTDIQEAFLTTSAGDSDKAAPQPLAQVLANLAQRAQRNFVDPGIPSNETITYKFADSDVDPWEAFTLIVQTRGYRIVNRDNIVTLARNEQDPFSPRTVKAEVWVWLDQSAKPRADRPGLAIQLADAHVAPNRKPQTVRSLEPGSNAKISLIDVKSERGDSILRLTVNPVLLPNGNIEAGLGIENAAPSLDGHKGVTIRRTINHTVELTPTKQVIEIDGILMPSDDPDAGKQTWIQRLFRKKTAEKEAPARMVVKLTVEPAAGSETPIPKSDSGKTGIVLAPRQNRRTPELTSIQTLKH